MIIDPVSAVVGGVSTIMGVFQAGAQAAAARQDYVNQTAFQNANSKYAAWQATFNKRVTDANSQYQYWQETVNYNQNLAYSRSLQNFELTRAAGQADVVGQTRAAAGANYIQQSQAVQDAMAERSMQDAVAYQQYTVQALKARSAVVAGNQEGASIDRYFNDYARQVGDYATLSQISQGLADRQYTRQQAGVLADYLSKYNSQSFYEMQPYMEPMAPFAPLPSLLQAPAPTMTGSPPSGAATALGVGSAVMGGVNSYFSAASALGKTSGSTGFTPRVNYSSAFG
jgi:hypothetical protein